MPGLSPRVRGHPGLQERADCISEVYPHVCGGIQNGVENRALEGRSIPTCAGASADRPAQSSRSPGLSPRVRGHPPGMRGTSFRSPVYPHVCGGIPKRGHSGPPLAGSIPTCAGASPATVCQEPGATGPSFRVSLRKSDILSQGQSLLLNVWVRAAKCNCSGDSIRFTLISGGISVNRLGVDVVIHLPLSFSTGGTASHG